MQKKPICYCIFTELSPPNDELWRFDSEACSAPVAKLSPVNLAVEIPTLSSYRTNVQ